MPWEDDARSLGDCLKAWAHEHGWRRQDAAQALRVSVATYNGWCDGRPAPAREPMIRRMMDLIDADPTRLPPSPKADRLL